MKGFKGLDSEWIRARSHYHCLLRIGLGEHVGTHKTRMSDKIKKSKGQSGLVGLTPEMGKFIEDNLDTSVKKTLGFRTLYPKFMAMFPQYTELEFDADTNPNPAVFLATKYKFWASKKKDVAHKRLNENETPASEPTAPH